ncbi:MAG: lysylphosphatidylglycerol synthase transmembrane domain-containing protein [Candidatus Omnitrophota bacterium]
MVNTGKLKLLLRFSISFGLLTALIWIMRNDIQNILEILKGSNRSYLIAALSISIPLSIVLAVRLKFLMEGQNIRLPMHDFIYLTFIGYFFNNFFPTSIGGDIAKAYYAYKKSDNKAGSYAAVVADRIIGLLAVISIAAIGLIFMGKTIENKNIFIVVLVMLLSAISIILALFSKKIVLLEKLKGKVKINIFNKLIDLILKLYDALHYYKGQKKLLIKAYLFSLVMQGCSVASIYFFILCLGGNMHILKLFLIIPLIWTVSMLPSLNGLGVREGAFVYFLAPDIGKETAFSVSLLWLGLIILFSTIGGIYHLLYPVKKELKKELSEGVSSDR